MLYSPKTNESGSCATRFDLAMEMARRLRTQKTPVRVEMLPPSQEYSKVSWRIWVPEEYKNDLAQVQMCVVANQEWAPVGKKRVYTTSRYWDCECAAEYHHTAEEAHCEVCGSVREDAPDSHLEEVLIHAGAGLRAILVRLFLMSLVTGNLTEDKFEDHGWVF